MALQPNPASLKMVASVKGRHVYPTLITWDGPGKLALVEVRPKDRPGDALPSERAFRFTGHRNDGTSSSAWLSIDEREYALWEAEFARRRTLSLLVRIDGVTKALEVKLTHVQIIPADFELILLDAAQIGTNAIARMVHAVWWRLRQVVPHRLSAPGVQPKQAAPPMTVSTQPSPSGPSQAEEVSEYDLPEPTLPTIPPPAASERRGTALHPDSAMGDSPTKPDGTSGRQ